jgi:hypothetical protein
MKTLGRGLLAIALCFVVTANAMDVRRFDQLSSSDQARYLVLLTFGTRDLLRGQGRLADAKRLEKVQEGVWGQFGQRMEQARTLTQNRASTDSRPPIQVEYAFLLAMRDLGFSPDPPKEVMQITEHFLPEEEDGIAIQTFLSATKGNFTDLRTYQIVEGKVWRSPVELSGADCVVDNSRAEHDDIEVKCTWEGDPKSIRSRYASLQTRVEAILPNWDEITRDPDDHLFRIFWPPKPRQSKPSPGVVLLIVPNIHANTDKLVFRVYVEE